MFALTVDRRRADAWRFGSAACAFRAAGRRREREVLAFSRAVGVRRDDASVIGRVRAERTQRDLQHGRTAARVDALSGRRLPVGRCRAVLHFNRGDVLLRVDRRFDFRARARDRVHGCRADGRWRRRRCREGHVKAMARPRCGAYEVTRVVRGAGSKTRDRYRKRLRTGAADRDRLRCRGRAVARREPVFDIVSRGFAMRVGARREACRALADPRRARRTDRRHARAATGGRREAQVRARLAAVGVCRDEPCVIARARSEAAHRDLHRCRAAAGRHDLRSGRLAVGVRQAVLHFDGRRVQTGVDRRIDDRAGRGDPADCRSADRRR